MAVSPVVLSLAAVTLDAALVAAAVGLARLVTADEAPLDTGLAEAGALALLLGLIGLARGDTLPAGLLARGGHVRRSWSAWLLTVGVALALGFLTKTSADYSRGTNLATLLLGGALLPLGRLALARTGRAAAQAGRLATRRVMLVGSAAEVDAFLQTPAAASPGWQIVAAAVLRDGQETIGDDLELAVATARMRRPGDIILLAPWGSDALVGRAVDALRRLPAAIHLGTPSHLGGAPSRNRPCEPAVVQLVRAPLSGLDIACKRSLDLLGACLGVLLLAPVLALVALAIRLDSAGPVLFRQRRTGYNQQPFRIFKFRSMSTMEDGATLQQATVGDRRITKVGAFLRRTSLDELPQLFNVIAGDMSLVGPRPHALAHDLAFGQAHALYPRRHNLRPGITGWAQVNGFRGETDSPDKIEGRVRYDLDYVDNWSLALDVAILFRTVFSPTTFKNAR